MKSKFTIKQILADHWSEFYSSYKTRSVTVHEVTRVLACGEPENGYAFYQCPHCGRYKFVPFRCHSRFCNTCGVAYQQDRAQSMAQKFISCRHRHVVFTIAEELRNFFLHNRDLFHILFRSAAQVMLHYFEKMNKKRHFTPGIVCGLHTFGRDLKWNPHIHMLITEGGLDKDGKWKKCEYFHYEYLRKSWMTVLLRNMRKALPESQLDEFNRIVSTLYNKNGDNGFYVNAPGRAFADPMAVSKYITRYIGRPAMAQSRITDYDGENVTYWYQAHEDGKIHHVTEHAHDFMKKLFIHIPEKGFNMLRFYGVYAKPDNTYKGINRLLKPQARKIYRINRKWQWRIELAFGYDPLICECGHTMKFIDTYNPCNPTKPPPSVLQSF